MLKAQALISFHKQSFKELYQILQSHHFSFEHHVELQELWMKAHYAEVDIKTIIIFKVFYRQKKYEEEN